RRHHRGYDDERKDHARYFCRGHVYRKKAGEVTPVHASAPARASSICRHEPAALSAKAAHEGAISWVSVSSHPPSRGVISTITRLVSGRLSRVAHVNTSRRGRLISRYSPTWSTSVPARFTTKENFPPTRGSRPSRTMRSSRTAGPNIQRPSQ